MIHVFAQALSDRRRQLFRSLAGCLDLVDQLHRDLTVRADRNRSGEIRLAPYAHKQHVFRPNDVGFGIDGRPREGQRFFQSFILGSGCLSSLRLVGRLFVGGHTHSRRECGQSQNEKDGS